MQTSPGTRRANFSFIGDFEYEEIALSISMKNRKNPMDGLTIDYGLLMPGSTFAAEFLNEHPAVITDSAVTSATGESATGWFDLDFCGEIHHIEFTIGYN